MAKLPQHNLKFLSIKRPRITEKSSVLAGENVYTFDVDMRANKKEIKDAIKAIYNVVPLKINVTKVPAKKMWFKKGAGVTNQGKKAVVYLKEGDKIEFV